MLFPKKSLIVLIFIFLTSISYSQIRSNAYGNLSIAESGFVTIFGQHNFMAGTGLIKPGILMAHRSSNPGFLIYSGESSWSGASEKQYIDGFVKSYHRKNFTFPIGHKGQYRPANLSDSYGSSAAYYFENPNKFKGEKPKPLHKISQAEYWEVNLNQDSNLTLSWSQGSKINQVIENDNLELLTIIGLTHNDHWEIIPSTIDEYVLNISLHDGKYTKSTKSKQSLGSITSLEKISADKYRYFTLASTKHKSNFTSPSIDIYPNPQIVGTNINLEYNLDSMNSGKIRIFKSDNSLVYELDINPNNKLIELPYLIKESGSYILSLTDSQGRSTFKNLIVVDQ